MKLPESLSKVDFQRVSDDFRQLKGNNDPGTWPLIPKIAVLFGMLLTVVAAGWWFIWKDQLDALSAAEAKEVQLKDEFVSKKRQAVNLDLYRQQLEEIDKSFGALLKQLPNRSEVEALLVEVNQAGLGRGLQFELFKPKAEVVKDFYAELPITVRINGNYHDLGAFAGDVAKLPRIVTLNNVAVSSEDAARGKSEKPTVNTGRLVMEMEVKTFRYLDEEEIAQRRQAELAEKNQKGKGGKKK